VVRVLDLLSMWLGVRFLTHVYEKIRFKWEEATLTAIKISYRYYDNPKKISICTKKKLENIIQYINTNTIINNW
jgi:hypothetical protein